MEKTLLKGNEAIGEAAIRAGCHFYFGYPITPQNELLEYMARRLPEVGGVFLQSESELAGINMLLGVAATGKRVMTSTSSPGMSLMQETISYLASMELPSLIVNITRASPGLGRIPPAQSDYSQATRGGGHGDYHVLVLAPSNVQEMLDLTMLAFELSDKYRIPAILLGDGISGQMMESAVLPEPVKDIPEKKWAATGSQGRERNLVISAPFTDEDMIALNKKLQDKYRLIKENEQRAELVKMEDAEYAIVAFGIVSRLVLASIDSLREKGYKVGLIRPITLWPFPVDIFKRHAGRVRKFLSVEMNEGQMVDDVRLAVNDVEKVSFFGGGGGFTPNPYMIEEEVVKLINNMEGNN